MRNNYWLVLLTLIALGVGLSGCYFIYKPDIKQGNILTVQKVNAIHIGMTKEEVVAVLGAPILINAFEKNQMIYVYTIQPGHAPFRAEQLRIYFVNGRVTGLTSTVHSTEPVPAAPV